MTFPYKVTWKGAADGNYRRTRSGKAIQAIVHHRMVGTLPGTDRTFNRFNPGHPVSTQFGIGHRTSGGPVEISQYVDLSDTAYGNGNWDPSGGWPFADRGVLINSRTVSIEHEDNGGLHTSDPRKGVVTEDIIAASIALDRLLLTGSVVAIRAAGIHVRETSSATQLGRIDPGRETIIDHNRIAGRLKPYCWRRWQRDPGFPQSRYIAELLG